MGVRALRIDEGQGFHHKKPKIKVQRIPSTSRQVKLAYIPLERQKKLKKAPSILSDQAREKLILETRDQAKKMSRSLLRKWRSRLDLSEVDSMVDLSLCEAAARFDISKGVSFITFLFYYLRGNLIKLITEATESRNITLVDCDSFDLNNEKGSKHGCLNSQEIASFINNSEQVLPDEILYRKEISAISKKACNKLESVEQEVISRVFLKEDNVYDLSDSLGYSRCHISRIKQKALIFLKRELSHDLLGKNLNLAVRLAPVRRRVSKRSESRDCNYSKKNLFKSEYAEVAYGS